MGAYAREPLAAASRNVSPPPPVPAVTPAPPPKPTVTAVEMGERQREISVSEFFTKNRHLLGFDNPRKALLTCVKEAVDNARRNIAELLNAPPPKKSSSPAARPRATTWPF